MAEHKQQTLSKKILKKVGLFERAGLPTYEQFVAGWMPRQLAEHFTKVAQLCDH